MIKKILCTIFILAFLSSCKTNLRLVKLENSIHQLKDSIAELNTKIKSTQIQNQGFTNNKNFTYLGLDAGKYNTSSENVFLGNSAGITSSVRNSLLVGIDAGVNSNGYGNVVIGNYAGQNINGNNNTLIGKATANKKIGSNNVVIGTHAGQKNGNFSNKLIIENSDSDKPLIFGDFNTDLLLINGDLEIDGYLNFYPKKKAPQSPMEGSIYYDLNSKTIKYWNGEQWIDLQ